MPEKITVITSACHFCRKPGKVEINAEDREKYFNWYTGKDRSFIQDLFPYLSAGDREQLMTGTHDECFDRAFPPEPIPPYNGDM